jgi:hypothetical protein
LHRVGDLFELTVKLRCQKFKKNAGFGSEWDTLYKPLTLSGKYCLSLPVGQLIARNLADSASWLLPRYRRYIISVQSLKVINFVIGKDITVVLFSSETWFYPTEHTE